MASVELEKQLPKGRIPLASRVVEWRLRRIESNPHARSGLLGLLRRRGGRLGGTLPLSVIRGVQDLRLRRTIRRVAARSPFYRTKFAELGIRPGDVRSTGDLHRLPFTPADDILDADRFLCVPKEEIGRIYTTSGSSREPKRIYRTTGDFERMVNISAFALRNRPSTGRIVCMIAHAQGLFGLAEPTERAVQRAGGLALPVGQPMPEETLKLMLRFRPNWFMCSPSYMAALTRQAEREGVQLPLESILLDGELLSARQAQRFAEYWGARVINGYGLAEVGVVGFSLANCDALHLNWWNTYAEIVNPESGRPADEGELVVTSLNQEGMPLVRYRTGDRVCRTECRCGMDSAAIHVFGRMGDSIVVAATNLYGPLVAEEFAKLEGGTGSLELLVDHADGVDRLILRMGVQTGAHLEPEMIIQRLFALYPALANDKRAEAFDLKVELVENLRLLPKPLRVRDLRG